MNVESFLGSVERLYHDAVFSKDACTCSNRELLRDRIKANLRTVLCDLIVLKKMEEDKESPCEQRSHS